jgi:hypothetical protein
MAAKIIYDRIEEVPEQLRERATKTDHGYELDAEPLFANHSELQREVQRFRAAAERHNLATEERDSLLHKLAEHEIERVIGNAGGNPFLLKPHVASYIRPEIYRGKLNLTVVDGSGNVRFNAATLQRLTLEELVDELKEDMNLQAAFKPSATSSSTSEKPPATASTAAHFRPERPKVVLSRAEAKDVRIYRAAVQQAGGVENVIIEAQ